MDNKSLTHKTLTNVSYSLIGFICPILFAIFITPIIVFSIGARDYGVFIFINSIISLVGLLDLGVSIATQKYITEYKSKEDTFLLKRLIGSINTIFFTIGLLGLLTIVAIGFIGCQFYTCSAETTFSYPFLFLIAGLIFFIEAGNSIYVVTLPALQRFDIMAKIGVAKIAFQQLTILAFILMGFSLYSMFLITLFYSIIFTLIIRNAAKKILPEARMLFCIDKEQIKKVYSYGLITTLNSFSNTSLVNLDRFLIPILLGPSKLTYYSLPGNVSSKIPGVINTVSSVLFPVTTELYISGQTERLKLMYQRSYRVMIVLTAAISVSIFLFAHKIMLYWLDETFAQESTQVLMILAVAGFILALQGFLSNFLYGIGKLKEITIVSLIMSVVNMILIFILLPKIGILGAAWAYLLSLFPVFYLQYVVENKYLKIKNIFKNNFILYLKIIFTTASFYVIYEYIIERFINNLLTLLIGGPISVLIYLLIFKLFGFFEKEDTDDIMAFINKSFSVFTKNEKTLISRKKNG